MSNCFYPANILLPDFSKIDGSKWAAIACDQFTSEPEYWESAEGFAGGSPSTVKLILPEVWLAESGERTPKINAAMYDYLNGVFGEHKNSMIYVERTQPSGGIRRGIVGMIDLECYDYKKGSTPLVRATEGTVVERIPPRVAVRRGAPVELPHVMLLIDDPEKTVIEPLSASDDLTPAYDFDLMLGGGHIRGQFLGEREIARVTAALDALSLPEAMKEKYGGEYAPLLFAVGDGNHSLAAARALYAEIKEKLGDAALSHPARYALVEAVNLHDEALRFEPIYRVMFGVEPSDVTEKFKQYAASLDGNADEQQIKIISGIHSETVTVGKPKLQLAVGTLQAFIDDYISKTPGVTVDYIHDEESARRLAAKENAAGFLFDGMGKNELFKTVIFDGALPRKTFSMGHARDKRYYLEARKIK